MSVLNIHGQSKQFVINGYDFSAVNEKLDTLEGAENEIIKLYRGNKELLSHTKFKEEGDCSSIKIQLGSYYLTDNDIIFYSYWAAADRMPSSLFPNGYMKQVYTVNSLGLVSLKEAKIYIEDFVDNENKKWFENNGWRHKGLKYLNEPPKNKLEQQLLDNYIKGIEKKYTANFVLNTEKNILESEIRIALKHKILEYTKDWIDGEVYGKVKK
jgi:hypothetical protein